MSGPVDWKGLFEWSIKHQDGTKQRAPGDEIKPMSEQDRKWFEEAMEHYSLDVTKRMKEIKRQLDAAVGGSGGGGSEEANGDDDRNDSDETQTTTPLTSEGLEELLEELTETVEDVDCARDLALIGGLPTLLSLIRAGGIGRGGRGEDSQPLITDGVVARAAEALGTAAQSNPPVQDWFLEGGALEAVLGLLRREGEGTERAATTTATTTTSAEVRQKALLALSCLARNCDRGTDALIAAGGVETILEHALAAVGEAKDLAKGKEPSSSLAASSVDAVAPRVARKAFQLLASLFRERPTESCLLPALSDGDGEGGGGGKFARAAASALRDQGKESGNAADVRLAAAAAVESLAKAASEAGIPIEEEKGSKNPSSLLLRAALETAESSAGERATAAGANGDEHGRDWAEEEKEACCAALRALSLKPKEKKEKVEKAGEKKKVVLSLPAAPSGS